MCVKKILVADDDLGILDVMKMILEDQGFEVLTTSNGNNILTLCEQMPDLIFLDLWMSGADGNIICSQIKAQEHLRQIPIIIFSANKNTEQIAFDCGANGFLAKPFDLKDLLNITREQTAWETARQA